MLAQKGSFEEAELIARKTHELQMRLVGPEDPDTASTAYTLACIAAHTRGAAEALALLRDAVSHGLKPNAALGIEKDPALGPLRFDPRFHTLVSYAREHSEAVSHPH